MFTHSIPQTATHYAIRQEAKAELQESATEGTIVLADPDLCEVYVRIPSQYGISYICIAPLRRDANGLLIAKEAESFHVFDDQIQAC